VTKEIYVFPYPPPLPLPHHPQETVQNKLANNTKLVSNSQATPRTPLGHQKEKRKSQFLENRRKPKRRRKKEREKRKEEVCFKREKIRAGKKELTPRNDRTNPRYAQCMHHKCPQERKKAQRNEGIGICRSTASVAGVVRLREHPNKQPR
jgi:hypothetical protein